MDRDIIGLELDLLLRQHGPNDEGVLADYIPELAKADPGWFGMSICTIDGSVHQSGDAGQPFTIQSISKPFVFALALADRGPEEILARIGVEPSGDSFNSILLDAADRPHNPMVNAGAITVVSLLAGTSPGARFDRILETLSAFAGRQLDVDEDVFESERNTGHRNRAIAHLMRTVGAIEGAVDDILDTYFRQCSVVVTSRDLAVMTATLANGGINPVTKHRVVDETVVGDVLSVMLTAGMYNYSGEWAYRTGLPAKSGVSGGVAALVPGQVGVGVFSPLLDGRGNSVRGVAVCHELSDRLGFHLFRNQTASLPPIRSITAGGNRRSRRVRPVAEVDALSEHGHRVRIVEMQGPWTFVSCERLMQELHPIDDDFIILDTTRVSSVDTTAGVLLRELVRTREHAGTAVAVAGTAPAPLLDLARLRFTDTDEALEWCEDRILSGLSLDSPSNRSVTLETSDLGRGLTLTELSDTERVGRCRSVDAGADLWAFGDPAASMCLVLDGHMTAHAQGRRVASFGPGAIVGEMGFMTGGVRSATVTADTPSTLLEFEGLQSLPPALQAKLHRNVALVMAERLVVTNEVLAALRG